MDVLDEAKSVLRTAEQQLRAILVQAAEGGDYDHLSRIAEWAKLLGATAAGHATSGSVPATRIDTPPASGGEPHERQLPAAAKATTRKVKSGRRKKTRKTKQVVSGYPKFVREGDSLVKIGWSKSEGKPYEHKAPHAVLRALVKELVRIGAGGERFTVESILPLKDADKSEIPDYQTYLTLAWLRAVDLIVQHGRQGYSLAEASELSETAEDQWQKLPAR